MNVRAFLALASPHPYFDLPMALHWTGLGRQSLLMQLARWSKAGYLIPLRRGQHTVAPPYRTVPLSSPYIANALYSPSYLSLEWALALYGLIPEAVPVFTSVTSRTPRTFKNPLGRFEYRHIQQPLFDGFERKDLVGAQVYLATPEKAILDYLYLSKGVWTAERHDEMRWQNLHMLRPAKLRETAAPFPDRVHLALDGLKRAKALEKGRRI
jgi:predicted transcriptional regulator of viral defense system